MTSDEHKAAAENLTAAIKNNTNGAYDEWLAHGDKLKDPSVRAAFVQKHAGLNATPSSSDMDAIHRHVAGALQNDVAEIQSKSAGAHVVGEICLAED